MLQSCLLEPLFVYLTPVHNSELHSGVRFRRWSRQVGEVSELHRDFCAAVSKIGLNQVKFNVSNY